MPWSPAGAFLGSMAVAAAGWRARALTGRGAVMATVTGSAILVGAGTAGGAALAAFFVLSSALSRLLPATGPVKAWDPKGDRRDEWQVLANGGAAAGAAIAALNEPALALWMVTASLASAAADTWATTFGARSRTAPRLLLLGRTVPAGTSGGMTLLGCAGAVLGAGSVAGAAALVAGDAELLAWAALLGTMGMAFDSLLGATVQGRFHCHTCQVASEWPVHRCGAATTLTGGMAWVTNDVVNGLTTIAGAVAGGVAWQAVAA